MRSWIIAAALALAATPALAQTTPAPAPYPDGAVAVAADQNGGAIEVSTSDTVSVALQSTPSVGSSWSVASQPEFLGEAAQTSGPTVNSTRPIMGAPRWQVFTFAVTAAGSGALTLEKKGRDGAVIETFTLTVTAQ